MRRLICAALLTLTACAGDLPVYSEVEDLRVLAVRATPPTFLFQQAPDVVFEALVLDPRGGEVEYTWTFCPVESSRACDDFEARLAEANPAAGTEFRGDLRRARELAAPSGTALPADADPSLLGAEPLRPYTVPAFTVPAATLNDLEKYYFHRADYFGFGMGAWPSAVLTLTRRGEDALVAQKRVVVTLANLAARGYGELFLAATGYSFCDPSLPYDQQRPGCLPWDPDLAGNRNPVFAALEWSAGDTPLAEWQALPGDGPLRIRAESSIRILPSFTAESFEAYQLVQADPQTRLVELRDATEDLSVSWFCTAGEVRDALTWPKFTKTLDTVYTAPRAPPEATGGLVTVWLVARDQRGGESWSHVDLLVEP